MTKKIKLGCLMIFIILAGLLTAAPPLSEWKLKVSAQSCSVFKSPASDSPVLHFLPAGTQLISYKKSGDWFRVVIGPDEQGYLLLGYVRTEDLEIDLADEQDSSETWPDKPHYFKEIGFTFRVFMGYNLISSGDIRTGANGLLDTSNDVMVSRGLIPANDFQSMKSVFELGGEILYNLSPRLAVGLGASHLRGGEINVIRYSTPSNEPLGQIDTDQRFSALPIRLLVKYSHPLSRLFNLTFTGVPTLYLAKLKYALINPLWNTDSIQIRTSSRSLGFSGILGIEFKLNPSAVFYLEGIGRYANLTGFKGDQHIFGETSASSNYSNTTNGTLYFIEGDKHPGLLVSGETPTGFRSVKRAVFSFSGFSLRAGISVRF